MTSRQARSRPGRGVFAASYASFFLIGWSGLFVPSLLLVLQDEWQRTDAEFGLAYFVIALLFAAGALSSGLLAQRIGRRILLPAAAALIAGGMVVEALAPSWAIFVIGAGLTGLGCGAIDAVVSSVIMDASAVGSGGGLNRLHLFYSLGALAAPLVIGGLIAAGAGWRAIALGTALGGVALIAPLAQVGTMPARERPPARDDAEVERPAIALRLALAALGIAIACYVAGESGVTSWLVGFLADQPMTVATFALGLYWAGLAVGRLIASRIADRFDAVRFTVACAVVGGGAILAAVIAPWPAVRIGLFGVAGFAFGPIYPMILAVAGSLFPHRAAAVAGLVTAAAVAGSITYPPLVGIASGAAGLAAGMAGAGLLIFASGAAVVVAGRVADRVASGRDASDPTPVRADPRPS